MLTIVLLILAAIFFILAVIRVSSLPWVALGLLAWVLTALIPALQR